MKNSLRQNNIDILDKCIAFLHTIGIRTAFEKINTECFLPGLMIRNGIIVIDIDSLLYPGDILHEAGHIAVVPPEMRSSLDQQSITTSKNREAEEMMAIAWSFAACIHLQIDPHIVFHEQGYKGDGKNIVDNFQNGRFIGTPMLQWCGMTIEPKNKKEDLPVYPSMIKWLRN